MSPEEIAARLVQVICADAEEIVALRRQVSYLEHGTCPDSGVPLGLCMDGPCDCFRPAWWRWQALPC